MKEISDKARTNLRQSKAEIAAGKYTMREASRRAGRSKKGREVKRLTKKQRKARDMELLRSVRDGKRYSRNWNLWAPFSQAALVNMIRKPETICSLERVELTDWGRVVLADWEKRERK